MRPERTIPDDLVLARLETRWHAPWLVAGFSHWGQHHAEVGLPNQDAFAIGAVGRTTWMAVADGVSTVPRSGEGAAFIVREMGQQIAHRLHVRPMLDAASMTSAIETARRNLTSHARHVQGLTTDYATTLLVAVLGEEAITVAKIGDGYVLALERDHGGARLVPLVENPLPREGGEVIDLTHADWKRHLRVRHITKRRDCGIDTVALGTDGCSRYFVRTEHADDDAKRKAVLNADLIDGQLAGNLQRLGARNLFVYLANLMGHRQFVDEGDDRTLLVATIAEKGLPCLPSTA